MEKEIVNQAQEVQRVPYRLMQGETHRDTLIKLTEINHKEGILKTAGEK